MEIKISSTRKFDLNLACLIKIVTIKCSIMTTFNAIMLVRYSPENPWSFKIVRKAIKLWVNKNPIKTISYLSLASIELLFKIILLQMYIYFLIYPKKFIERNMKRIIRIFQSVKQYYKAYQNAPCQKLKDQSLLENNWPTIVIYAFCFAIYRIFHMIIFIILNQSYKYALSEVFLSLLPFALNIIFSRISNQKWKIRIISFAILLYQNLIFGYIYLFRFEYISGERPYILMMITQVNLIIFFSHRFYFLLLINFFLQCSFPIFFGHIDKLEIPSFIIYYLSIQYIVIEKELLSLKVAQLISFQKQSLLGLSNGICIIEPQKQKMLFQNAKFEQLINEQSEVGFSDRCKQKDTNQLADLRTNRDQQSSIFINQKTLQATNYSSLLKFFSNIELEEQSQVEELSINCNVKEEDEKKTNLLERYLQLINQKHDEHIFYFRGIYSSPNKLPVDTPCGLNRNVSIYDIAINTSLRYQSQKCILIEMHDITSSITSDYLEKMNDFKSKILKSISHELRTRLNIVQGILEILKYSPLPLEIIEQINSAYNNCRIQSYIIGSIVDYNLYKENQLNKKSVTEDIRNIINEVITFFKQEAELKKIRIGFDYSNLSEFTLITDIERLYQILVNIISNSIKFNKISGQITIAKQENKSKSKSKFFSRYMLLTPQIMKEEIEFTAQKRTFHISIKDTGIGMSPQKLKEIKYCLANDDFVVKTTTEESTGFMLGLRSTNVLLQSLNELSGNWMNVCSAKDYGTTVHLTIFNQISQSFVDQEGTINKLYKTMTKKPSTNNLQCKCEDEILIVDDEPFNLVILEQILKSLGKKVVKANNGQESVSIFQDKLIKCPNRQCPIFSAILMDYQMPLLNGKQATIQILRICKEQGQMLPLIIGCTAFSAKSDLQELKDAGMKEILLKPVTKNVLGNLFQKIQKEEL